MTTFESSHDCEAMITGTDIKEQSVSNEGPITCSYIAISVLIVKLQIMNLAVAKLLIN
ncbi:MAG: hypothetical protein J3R72DRAFT_490766 [Linnemannia gamsii]|nr:MAG: hypothetical protein J3R72DRAFT_490766 [Linnemannia gamsii]